MSFTITLPSEYGYVIAVAAASGVFLQYLGSRVFAARKKYDVKYPYMYADQASAEKDKNKFLFNCVQRGHQNALEIYPTVLALLLLGGLKHPLICAASGVVWMAGRFFYAQGYATGEPSKRQRGAFGYLGLFAMLGSTISLSLSLLKLI
eukprot:TRINITY_DN16125_c0_g1_i1.p1 TRINITY_DN16125_c0_g1~~TRINITY_DN16125_c0_g1_i1.p1  ORF type:complete len:157 (+),score=22.37 TRINITY_DN16125_c0_g1_i1:25-471(+)